MYIIFLVFACNLPHGVAEYSSDSVFLVFR